MQKIFIFGRGQYFREKYITFKTKYNICGFIDNAFVDETEDEFEIYLDEFEEEK